VRQTLRVIIARRAAARLSISAAVKIAAVGEDRGLIGASRPAENPKFNLRRIIAESVAKLPLIARVTHMTTFPVHTIDSAPEHSKPALKQLQSAFGMIPNILGVMATSPVLINSLLGLFAKVHGGSFTEAQVQIVLLTDAVTNGSIWAVAFHSALALKEGIDPQEVQAIREGRLPKDTKHAALSALAKTMIEKRGHLNDQDVDRFIATGFNKDHLLEVIGIVAASTITNYTGSITKPPLEALFQVHAWEELAPSGGGERRRVG
jgi:alkylhydroperoxidase family enzyme